MFKEGSRHKDSPIKPAAMAGCIQSSSRSSVTSRQIIALHSGFWIGLALVKLFESLPVTEIRIADF